VACASPPAVAVDGTRAGKLEVLSRVTVHRLCFVERVGHAYAFHRFLGDTIDNLRRGHTGGFQDGRDDVNEMGELPAHSALVLDARRPGNRNCGAATAPRGHHFAIVVWTTCGVGPGCRNAAEGARAAEFVQTFRDLVNRLRDAVDPSQLVHLAVHTAFGSWAVVANGVDD